MEKIPNKSVDFICADFPYNISNNNGLTKRGDKIVKSDFGKWDKFHTMGVYFDFVFRICKQYKRILKPHGSAVLFFSYRYAGWIGYELERRKLFTFRQPIIFNKLNPLPSYKKNGFRSSYEIGIWLVNDDGDFQIPRTFNFLGQSDMKSVLNYRIGKFDGEKQTVHPTEKPERLISQLIEIFTNP